MEIMYSKECRLEQMVSKNRHRVALQTPHLVEVPEALRLRFGRDGTRMPYTYGLMATNGKGLAVMPVDTVIDPAEGGEVPLGPIPCDALRASRKGRKSAQARIELTPDGKDAVVDSVVYKRPESGAIPDWPGVIPEYHSEDYALGQPVRLDVFAVDCDLLNKVQRGLGATSLTVYKPASDGLKPLVLSARNYGFAVVMPMAVV